MNKPFSILDAGYDGAEPVLETSWGMTEAQQRRQDAALRDVMLASLRFGNLELDEIKVSQQRDPRGRAYYWLGGRARPLDTTPGTDEYWLSRGYATLTPLTSDRTCRNSIAQMMDWTT